MKSIKNRKVFTAFLYVVSFLAFFVLFSRLAWLMVVGKVGDEDLRENMDFLYASNQEQYAERGTIFDRNGNPIALDATSYKMVATLTDQWSNPKKPVHVQDATQVAEVLAKHLPLEFEEIKKRLEKDAAQVEFGTAGRHLSYHQVSKIRDDLASNDLTGINFVESKSRLYPNGTFASHTIGLAEDVNRDDASGKDEDEEKPEDKKSLDGVTGIEAAYDDVLRGKNGYYRYKKDSQGYVIPDEPVQLQEPVHGDHVYTTIDRQLQIHLENILDDINQKNNPANVLAAVMEVETGDMLALAQRPSFNAETRENIEDTWQNLFVETAYEPGSTFKLLTTAAAVEEGIFSPERYFKSGRIATQGGVITDFNRVGWGWISHLEGLSKSSNVLFVQLVEEIGLEKWKKYLDSYHFAEKTGIELPSEVAGSNPYDSPLQQVNTAFGQGVSVTTAQLLQAFSALGNDGVMVRPRIVSKVVDEETGNIEEVEPVYTDTMISEESAKKTLDYARQASEMTGSLTQDYLRDDASILAKTGTAQLVNPNTGKYYENEFVHSAVAMFPAEDPRYVIYVTIQRPQLAEGDLFGGTPVQKIYNQIMDRLVDYDEQQSQNSEVEDQFMDTPDYLGMSQAEVTEKLQGLSSPYAIIGSGEKIVQQYPLPATPFFDDQLLLVMTDGAMTMPDVTGWSRNDILKISEITGVRFSFVGDGYAVKQSVPAGGFIKNEQEIKIDLSPEEHPEEADDEHE